MEKERQETFSLKTDDEKELGRTQKQYGNLHDSPYT
jgi:hypothetical protein